MHANAGEKQRRPEWHSCGGGRPEQLQCNPDRKPRDYGKGNTKRNGREKKKKEPCGDRMDRMDRMEALLYSSFSEKASRLSGGSSRLQTQ